MTDYKKAKPIDYGDGPEPCEECAYKQKRITELEDVLKKIWKISSNRRGVRVLIAEVIHISEGGGDEMISPKGIVTSKKAYDRFHAEGGGDEK